MVNFKSRHAPQGKRHFPVKPTPLSISVPSSAAASNQERARLALVESDANPRSGSGSDEKWFNPQKERGWHKTQDPTTRRSRLLGSTDKRSTKHDRYLEAARAAQALANVTKDQETREKAQADADYFYAKARVSPAYIVEVKKNPGVIITPVVQARLPKAHAATAAKGVTKMKHRLGWDEGNSFDIWECKICGKTVYSESDAESHEKGNCSKPQPFLNFEAEETEW